MKKLLTILIFFAQYSWAQTGVVNGWNYIVTLPADYYSTMINYPTIIFFPGRGEVGTNVNVLKNNGPHAYIEQGGLIPSFIVITVQPPAEFPSEALIDIRISSLKSLFRIDTNRISLTGLSHGGWCASTYVAIYPTKAFSVITVQGMIPDDNSPYPEIYSTWKGKHLCFEQSQDGRGGLSLINYLNSVHKGQATFIETNYNGGGHCCYNQFYGGQGVRPSAFMLNGKLQNIYQYLTEMNKYSTVSLPTDTTRIKRKKVAAFRQAGNTIYFKASDFDNYSIINMLGQVVQLGNYRSGMNEISIKEFAPGVYVLKTQFENYKIIKN